jgi:GAF domain-containing protein
MFGEDVQQGLTGDLVCRVGLNIDRLHEIYAETGGMESKIRVIDYLDGITRLPGLQRDLISNAVNELLTDSYSWAGSERAPYSSSEIAVACGFAGSDFDGDRLSRRRSRRPHAGAVLLDYEEADRAASLRASGLLDAPVTERLERLPLMARAHFGTVAAAFTLVDDDRLISKSIAGLPGGDNPRNDSFCSETVRQDRTLVVSDTLRDPRFLTKAHVVGPPYIRFYAGHPVFGPGGSRIGALCIVDDQPRHLSSKDEHKLRTLAALVQLEILL